MKTGNTKMIFFMLFIISYDLFQEQAKIFEVFTDFYNVSFEFVKNY